jgi:hypothetical protein
MVNGGGDSARRGGKGGDKGWGLGRAVSGWDAGPDSSGEDSGALELNPGQLPLLTAAIEEPPSNEETEAEFRCMAVCWAPRGTPED